MSRVVLSVENLSKKFCRSLKKSLWYGMRDLTSELFARGGERRRLRPAEFWALKDVSFEVRQGETLGLIGHNGAGKSTLLKLINGLIKPDEGRICVGGRVGALIELGAGFHPVLTGRENIYVNAAILGLSRDEVDRRLDEILEFAEIGEFINAPVQSYSSGMKVRLGFSVAAHLNPDLLLIDEILSVGDASFRQRCIDRLAKYKRGGGTVIFVSHNSRTVEEISDRVMLLGGGRQLALGDPVEVVERYEAQALELSRKAVERGERGPSSDEYSDIWFPSVECYDTEGNPRSDFEFGEPFEVRIQYEAERELSQPYFVLALQKFNLDGPPVAWLSMLWDDIQVEKIPPRGVVRCMIGDARLTPGNYFLQVGVQASKSLLLGKKWYARPKCHGGFTVTPGGLRSRFPGITSEELVSMTPPVYLTCSWEVNREVCSPPDPVEANLCPQSR